MMGFPSCNKPEYDGSSQIMSNQKMIGFVLLEYYRAIHAKVNIVGFPALPNQNCMGFTKNKVLEAPYCVQTKLYEVYQSKQYSLGSPIISNQHIIGVPRRVHCPIGILLCPQSCPIRILLCPQSCPIRILLCPQPCPIRIYF
jgi:hypothetical protein